MENEVVTPVLTPAEKHYAAMKRAQASYHRRKNPNPKPVGRPRKVVATPPIENESLILTE